MKAEDIWAPAPELTPAEVVDQVLTAFSNFSRERAVRVAFNFASPSLRVKHNDLDGFDWYLSNPARMPLLDWDDHRRASATAEGDTADVTVYSYDSDDSRVFHIPLRKASEGKYEGCWLVTRIENTENQVPDDAEETVYVEFGDKRVACEYEDTLRDVLLDTPGMNPHNGLSGSLNCGGSGVCGTCAVRIKGRVGELTGREKRRLSLPPHSDEDGLRLACQTTVKGDVTVRKQEGFFGTADQESTYSEVEVTDAEYSGSYEYHLI